MAPDVLEIHPESSFKAIASAIEQATSFLRGRGVSSHALFVTELSLEELMTNVAKYSKTGSMRVCVEDDGQGEVTLKLEDDGVAFDPWAAPDPRKDVPVLERSPGGQGIMLIKKFATRCDYERQAEKNCVRVQIARNSES